MFGRRKNTKPDEMLTKFFDHHIKTENMKADARSSVRPVVKLMPQIPIGNGPSVGWFGGTAALPEKMVWPERNGEKLLFVGQINLAALPKGLWSGLGPRQGWLGVFLPSKWPHQPTLLHFDGPLVETAAPTVPNDADWARGFNFKEPRTFALPRWPVVLKSLPGNEFHNSHAQNADKDAHHGSLFDPAYHPFNQETVALLFNCLEESIARLTRQIIRFPEMKKLRPTDAAWFNRQKPIMLNSFVRFFEIEGKVRANRQFSESTMLDFIRELKTIAAYNFKYLRDDEQGYCELELSETTLLDLSLDPMYPHWWHPYNTGLTNHALKAYTSDPNSLPAILRQRLEPKWQQDTPFGLGTMGHAPVGHIYTPHGLGTPNEVLLELHTSDLTGWIWGDCYSLVILIDRKALRRGDFGSVKIDITN